VVATIASRRAGLNLLKIVVLLLVPICLFGYLYMREAEQDIGLLLREQKGAVLANFAAPVLFGKLPEPNAAERAQILALQAEILGANPHLTFDALLAAQSNPAVGRPDRVRLAESYISDVLLESGLLLDSDPETMFLVVSVLGNLPDLLSRYQDVVGALKPIGGLSDPLFMAPVPRDLLPRIGNADEAYQRLRENFVTARRMSGGNAAYDQMGLLVDHIRFDIREMEGLAINVQNEGGPQRVARLVRDISNSDHMIEEARELWKSAVVRVSSLIEKRSETLERNYLVLKVIGLLSAIVAIGYALLLFNTALRKLDEVERAHESEAAARVEAEGMSSKLAQMNDGMVDLNRQLATNLERLKDAQDELLKKGRMEQLGQLTATIAHELRNPLGAVRNSAFLLERKARGKGLDVESQVARINKSVQRCDDIITQLIDFSRLKKVVTRPDNLDRWLARTVESLAAQVPDVIRIECVLGLDDKDVPFDSSRLERAIANLMNNAAEAMVDERAGSMKLAVPHPCIVVSTFLEDGMACLRVTDNGPGIAPDLLEKVKEPLFTTKSFGTGLGLPAVEQIAIQHDGRLTVEAAPGGGCCVTIRLPVQARLGEAA